MSHGTFYTVVGQLVTVNVGNVPADTKATIRIRCTVLNTAYEVDKFVNCAVVVVEDPDLEFTDCLVIDVELEFIPEGGQPVAAGRWPGWAGGPRGNEVAHPQDVARRTY